MRYSPPPELEGGLDKHNKRGGIQSGKVKGENKNPTSSKRIWDYVGNKKNTCWMQVLSMSLYSN